MPWPVYTERLLAFNVTGVWASALVPAGKRAIIKSVVALNSSSTVPLKVHCVAANLYFGAFVIQEAYKSQSSDVLAVAYAGDEIRTYMEGQSGSVLITGWLLEDPSGTRRSPLDRSIDAQAAAPGTDATPLA